MDSDDDMPIGKRSGKKRNIEKSEDDEPVVERVHRKASLASREGIKRGARSESESEDDSDEDMVSGSDESSSSGSDGSDSVDSEDEKPKKRVVRKVTKKAVPKKAATPKKKAATPAAKPKAAASKSSGKKRVVESESEPESEDEGNGAVNEVKLLKQVQNRTAKEQLVADVLCRWWYVLPEWPPADFDYAAVMAVKGLRLVSLDKWEDEPDMDKAGNMKCYALTQYKGLFRDAAGGLRDLRPSEGKPCYGELIKKSEKELQSLLSAALTKQLEVLQASGDNKAGPIIADLKERLRNVGKKR